MKDTTSKLEALRRRIRNLDVALLGLAAERTELAREIGAAKRAVGIPLRDFEVEKRVLERASETAAALELDPELARGLLRELIEEACRVQEADHYSGFSGEAEAILVVGGAGRLGGWLTRFFESQGHRVSVMDPQAKPGGPPRAESLAAGLAGASMAFVATPLAEVGSVIEQISEIGFGGVVCDVASLKAHLRPVFERARARGVAVTSLHPMFGPDARTLSEQVIVICDCGVPEATERVVNLFRETAARLVPLSLERHDEIAAHVLGMSHLMNLAFGLALSRCGLSHAELAGVGSTTFRRQMGTTAAVAGESPELYFSIQRLNGATPRVVELLKSSIEAFEVAVREADGQAFADLMREQRRWIGPDGG